MPRSAVPEYAQPTARIIWAVNDIRFEAEGPEHLVTKAFEDFSDYMAICAANDIANAQAKGAEL